MTGRGMVTLSGVCPTCVQSSVDLAVVVPAGRADRLLADLSAARAVLADREAELLALKGPCSSAGCPLHYAHSGPCDLDGGR